VESQMKNLNLRQLATNHASRYLQVAQAVFLGTSKGNPTLNGETLKEEIDEQFFSSVEWEVGDISQVPFPETKLYGGQQFERLFAEFKFVSSNVQLDASHIGATSLPGLQEKNFFWTACEIAQRRLEDVFVPLIDQLLERTRFVMKRVPLIVENVINSKESLPNPRYKQPVDMKHFAPLSATLRDLFNAFVDKNHDICKTCCMEEFYPIKTVVWFMHQSLPPNFESKFKDENRIVQEIFKRMRERVTKNVLRKIYNFFLLPFMSASLWQEIQTHIYCLDVATLNEILDSNSIEDDLDRQLELLETNLEKMHESELNLHQLVPKFQVQMKQQMS